MNVSEGFLIPINVGIFFAPYSSCSVGWAKVGEERRKNENKF
jgi:hypothetical protein